MAENLLHTHSGYAKNKINKSFLTTIHSGKSSVKSKIDKIKAKEEQLYREFDCNTYNEFLSMLRSLFDEKDRQVIDRFEANYLSQDLERFASKTGYLLNQEVKINVDLSKLDKLHLKLSDKGRKQDIISFEGLLTMKGTGNGENDTEQGFKRWFNDNFKGRRFVTSSDYSKAVLELLDGDAFTVQVKTGKGKNAKFETIQNHNIENYPWGITKKDIEEAEGDPELQKDLQDAIKSIHDYIFYDLGAGASPELITAMGNVWKKNFSKHWYSPAQFFAGTTTGNFISAVQGSLGEFQTAVLFEYLSIKGLKQSRVAKIVGNVYKKGEQGKTDVEIFKTVGFQVKNLTSIEQDGQTKLIRDISTNIHPSKMSKYFDKETSTNFLNFLANFYFNTDYRAAMEGRMNQLEYRLSYWLAENMNIAILDSTVKDTVSFYIIGGKYLVPCSAILEASDELGLKSSIEITSTYQGHSDLEYARHKTKPTKENPNGTPLYQLYWTKETGTWRPQSENQKKEFDNLINSRISIRTHFNLFKKIEDYALW